MSPAIFNQKSQVSKIAISFTALFQVYNFNRFSLNLIPRYNGTIYFLFIATLSWLIRSHQH